MAVVTGGGDYHDRDDFFDRDSDDQDENNQNSNSNKINSSSSISSTSTSSSNNNNNNCNDNLVRSLLSALAWVFYAMTQVSAFKYKNTNTTLVEDRRAGTIPPALHCHRVC